MNMDVDTDMDMGMYTNMFMNRNMDTDTNMNVDVDMNTARNIFILDIGLFQYWLTAILVFKLKVDVVSKPALEYESFNLIQLRIGCPRSDAGCCLIFIDVGALLQYDDNALY
jgi:hypothetical protein